MINVGVIFGSKSVEHEISILTYLETIKMLDGYNVVPIYITKDLDMYLVKKELNDLSNISYNQNKISFIKGGIRSKFISTMLDVCIICTHGLYGEDGMLASLLDMYDIAYVGSNNISSGIMIDKIYSKMLLEQNGFPITKYKWYEDYDIKTEFPCIVKPYLLGSSIGISVCHNLEELNDAAILAYRYGKRIIVEEYLDNIKEYNCAAYRFKDEIIVSNIEEVISGDDILDYKNKYEGKNSKRVIPAEIDEELKFQIEEYTKKIYHLFDLSGVVRIDYMFKDNLYVNEINTIPGSLAYYLFPEPIIDCMIKTAIMDKNNKRNYITSYNKNILELASKGK